MDTASQGLGSSPHAYSEGGLMCPRFCFTVLHTTMFSKSTMDPETLRLRVASDAYEYQHHSGLDSRSRNKVMEISVFLPVLPAAR